MIALGGNNMVKKESRGTDRESADRKYNYRGMLENFFPTFLIKVINNDLENRNITEICKRLAIFGEMPILSGEQEVEVSRIIHEYLDDLQRKPEQRRLLTGTSKEILDRYVIDATERMSEENSKFPNWNP
jgi:hypothetical protein